LNRETTLARISDWARREGQIKRVYLFGSFMRGVSQPNDIDLALELIPSAEESFSRFYFNVDRWDKELRALLGKEVELQHAEPGHERDSVAYRRDGSLIIFDRITHQVTDFRTNE